MCILIAICEPRIYFSGPIPLVTWPRLRRKKGYNEGLMIEAVPNTVTYKVEAKPSLISLINDDAKQSYLFKVLEHAEIIKLITS